jgi:hypothetical protein
MSQSTRLYGADIALVTVGAEQFVNLVSDVSINYTMDTQEAVALKDNNHFPKPIRSGKTIEIAAFVDTAARLMNVALGGEAITFSIQSGGSAYSGTGIITTAGHMIPDGPQTQKATITVQGKIVITPG